MELIDKQATIDWLKKVTVTEGITFEAGFEQIIYDIEQMPSVTPTRPTGKWEKFVDDYKKCSKCGKLVKFYRNYKYCPNCGAKMIEVE